MHYYEIGFRDALDLLEHMLIEKNLYNDSIKEIIDFLRSALTEKRVSYLKYMLAI